MGSWIHDGFLDSRRVLGFTMGSWVHDKVHVKSPDFFEPCAKAAKYHDINVCLRVSWDPSPLLTGYPMGSQTGYIQIQIHLWVMPKSKGHFCWGEKTALRKQP